MPGLDRHVRIAARAPPLARPGRVPGRERLGRDPDCEAAPLLQRPVVLRPVADLVARPRDLVTAWLMDLVGHRSSGERGDGPIRSTVALPKPEAVILHQRRVELHWAREDVRDRAGLERTLSRERVKDTTLDYQAGFAKRRGIDMSR